MATRHRLLIVDDEPRMCQILRMVAERWGYDVQTAANGAEALTRLEQFNPEVVVSDLKMPTMDGEELLKQVRSRSPETPVIMMTAHATVKSAVEAMKIGAFDYIMKPFDNEELRIALSRAIEFSRLKTDNAYLRRELGSRYQMREIKGESRAIQEVLAMVSRVAPTRATVLVTGESGTGKELIARAIHFSSPRATGAFVAINCAALTETLLESELFGHEKGAFTGANRTHRGKFEEADGGTIFLDEIGETNNSFQTKLLRVLQEGTFERVGGGQTIRVDVRVVAATNRNLEERVAQKAFREDLYYRLKVVPIHLPPLRERPEDIPDLAVHFVRKACDENRLPPKRLTPDAIEALMRGEWRGNVRELENTIERAVILTRGEEITSADLWLPPSDGTLPRVLAPVAAPLGGAPAAPVAGADSVATAELLNLPLGAFLDEMTKKRVLAALDSSQWRKQEAADALGIDRATLYRMIKKFGIE